MPAASLLSSADIRTRLTELPEWRLDGGHLVRIVETRDFRSALDLVTRIADPADVLDHHPDVAIHWNVLTLTLWTHAAGGITERDFRLVAEIDRILADHAP